MGHTEGQAREVTAQQTRKQQTAYRRADEKVEALMAQQLTKEHVEEVLEAERRKGRKRSDFSHLTAEQIVAERDGKGLSWAQVAANLDLKSPSAARAAYTALTGKPHTESVMTGRARSGTARTITGKRRKTMAAMWNDDSDQDEIIEAITHKSIRVVREFRGIELPEEIVHVNRIVRFAFDGPDHDGPLVIHFYSKDVCECSVKDPKDADTGRARTFRVADIKEVL